MQNIENDENVSTNTIAVLRTELAAKDKSVAHLKNEMEKISKQQSHSKTLMNTLQKENLAKDTLLQHAKTDIDKLKKALKEKEAILASVTAKVSDIIQLVNGQRKEPLVLHLKFPSPKQLPYSISSVKPPSLY